MLVLALTDSVQLTPAITSPPPNAQNQRSGIPRSASADAVRTSGGGEASSSFESSFPSGAGGAASGAGTAPGSVGVTPSGRLAKLSSNRLNTDAMLQVLQQDIRTKGRRSSMSAGPEIVVGECLGEWPGGGDGAGQIKPVPDL